jgi:hypothetical protein
MSETLAREEVLGKGWVERTYTIRDWLDSICNLRELLSLSENELVQLEDIDAEGPPGKTRPWH